MLPDLIVDPSITLSHAARSLLSRIASEFTNEQRLLLCCAKWNLISRSWDFYYCAFGDEDALRQHMQMAVRTYRMFTGVDMTIEDGLSCFAQLKVCKELHSICECAK
jgi:hypothetical protein